MDQSKKILIVEDEVSLINVLHDKLTNEGYNVLEAIDGKDGLRLALAEHPDLILLDINLPVMDGITMLKELRKDDFGKKVEVVMLTNYSEYKLLADAMAQGAHDYLVKSDWKLEDVVKLIHNKLEPKKQ
jgi:two-component system chemotaxis response regulator CheY